MPETDVLEQPKVEKKETLKKSDANIVIYKMINANPKIEGRDDIPIYPPYRLVKNTDTIVWTDENGESNERSIRYLRGWDTIFVDEQEKNGRVVPQNILDSPQNKFEIIDGEIRIQPSEKSKLYFWELCNHNIDSKHRTGKVAGFMRLYSEENDVAKLAEKQDLQERAMEIAFKVKGNDIFAAAKRLGIPLTDVNNGATRTEKAVQTDFRQYAITFPDKFLKEFDEK